MVAQEQAARANAKKPVRSPRTAKAPTQPTTTVGALPVAPVAPARPRRNASRSIARVDRPAVAPCANLDDLRALTPEQARDHVERYLRAVMPAEDADAFEASAYRWELHLVELNQVRLVRGVDLVPSRMRRYRAALNKGTPFPPLIGLGGEGAQPTDDALLCDGYHRVAAMRAAGFHFVWMWLAVDLWRPTPEAILSLSGYEI